MRGVFAIVNRLTAISGYSHGTVVSVHPTEFEALLADQRLQRGQSPADGGGQHVPMFVLPLAVWRRKGEHVRLSDLATDKGAMLASNEFYCGRVRLRRTLKFH